MRLSAVKLVIMAESGFVISGVCESEASSAGHRVMAKYLTKLSWFGTNLLKQQWESVVLNTILTGCLPSVVARNSMFSHVAAGSSIGMFFLNTINYIKIDIIIISLNKTVILLRLGLFPVGLVKFAFL